MAPDTSDLLLRLSQCRRDLAPARAKLAFEVVEMSANVAFTLKRLAMSAGKSGGGRVLLGVVMIEGSIGTAPRPSRYDRP
jgi:hypothetical protein